MLKLGLSLHIYSPKVEMFAQIAAERHLPACPIVADVGGSLTCDIAEMNKLIKQVRSITFKFKHYNTSQMMKFAD